MLGQKVVSNVAWELKTEVNERFNRALWRCKEKKSNKKVMSASIKTVLSASLVDLYQLQQEMQQAC